MSIETVVSIIESASGDGLVSEILSMSATEFAAFSRARGAQAFFANMSKNVAEWVARIRYLRAAGYGEAYITAIGEGFGAKWVDFHAAMSQIAAEEAAITHASLMAEATAAEGTLVAGAGTTVACIALPVIAMVAVGVALGAPYYQAREEARKEGYSSGFGKGFITGLLDWEARFTIERFWDDAVFRNDYDEAIPKIRANSHNTGLIKGRIAGLAKSPKDRKLYLKGLRKLTVTSTAGWTSRNSDWMEQQRARQVQITYVMDLYGAARKHGLIKEE